MLHIRQTPHSADSGMLDLILQEYKVTHVLALAAQAGVRYATKDPASYVASNVAGTRGRGIGFWATGEG
jgi:nucleoside-diphosphate-sugar epimerase